MVTLPLYMDGNEVGTLEVRLDGLRLWLFASCKVLEGVNRAYAVSGGESLAVGVLAPTASAENPVMTARKTYNLSSIRGFDCKCITHGEINRGNDSSPWVRAKDPCGLFSDKAIGKSLDLSLEYWIKPEKDGILVAVPFGQNARFPVPAVFSLCRVVTVRGRRSAVFFCVRGIPAPSEESCV